MEPAVYRVAPARPKSLHLSFYSLTMGLKLYIFIGCNHSAIQFIRLNDEWIIIFTPHFRLFPLLFKEARSRNPFACAHMFINYFNHVHLFSFAFIRLGSWVCLEIWGRCPKSCCFITIFILKLLFYGYPHFQAHAHITSSWLHIPVKST